MSKTKEVKDDEMTVEFSTSENKVDRIIKKKNGVRYEIPALIFNEEETLLLFKFLSKAYNAPTV